MNIEQAAASIDQRRKKAKSIEWWYWTGEVDGIGHVAIKGHQTWVQRLECPAFTDAGPSGCNVEGFRTYIAETLQKAAKQLAGIGRKPC